METRFNKHAIRLGDARKVAREGKKGVLHGFRSPADGAPTPMGNASDGRYGQRYGTDSYDVNTVPYGERRKGSRKGQPALRGSGHTSRFNGTGARPYTGKDRDGLWSNPTEAPSVMRVEAVDLKWYRTADGQERDGLKGLEWKLLRLAREAVQPGGNPKKVAAEIGKFAAKFDNPRLKALEEALLN